MESSAGLEGVSAELKEHVEEVPALAVQAISDRRFEFEEARDAVAQPPDVGEDDEGPVEQRGAPTVPWGFQCINKLFGFGQGALAQQRRCWKALPLRARRIRGGGSSPGSRPHRSR
jgi:hypothetical protein